MEQTTNLINFILAIGGFITAIVGAYVWMFKQMSEHLKSSHTREDRLVKALEGNREIMKSTAIIDSKVDMLLMKSTNS